MALPDASALYSFGIGNDTDAICDVSDDEPVLVPDKCRGVTMYKCPMRFQLRSDTSIAFDAKPQIRIPWVQLAQVGLWAI